MIRKSRSLVLGAALALGGALAFFAPSAIAAGPPSTLKVDVSTSYSDCNDAKTLLAAANSTVEAGGYDATRDAWPNDGITAGKPEAIKPQAAAFYGPWSSGKTDYNDALTIGAQAKKNHLFADSFIVVTGRMIMDPIDSNLGGGSANDPPTT